MRLANPSRMGVVVAAFSRAGRIVVGMLPAHRFISICVGGATRHCARPIRTVSGADKRPCNTWFAAIRRSAEPVFPAVPITEAASLLRIGAAAADKTLAVCAVFEAQAV